MNAYQLADELSACFTKADFKYVDDVANMLRQQSSRIKEMEDECSAMREQLKHLEAQIYGGTTK